MSLGVKPKQRSVVDINDCPSCTIYLVRQSTGSCLLKNVGIDIWTVFHAVASVGLTMLDEAELQERPHAKISNGSKIDFSGRTKDEWLKIKGTSMPVWRADKLTMFTAKKKTP